MAFFRSNRYRIRRTAAARRKGYYRGRRNKYLAIRKRQYSNKMRKFKLYRNPFQQSRFTTNLIYNTNVLLDPAASALTTSNQAAWGFRANSLYDPDYTGTGHQPMYFDQYAAMFAQYRVISSTIKVTVISSSVNTATSNSSGTVTTQPNYPYRLAIFRDTAFSNPTADLPNDMNNLIEEGGSNVRWRYVCPSLTGKLPSLKFNVKPHVMCNLSYGDDQLSALCTSSPARGCVFGVCISSADGTTDPPQVSVGVRIIYKVQFFDRILNQLQN